MIHIAVEQPRVIGDNGTVVVVGAFVLVDVVGQTRIEDRIDAPGQEILDMSVHDLRGIAGGIRWNGELPALVIDEDDAERRDVCDGLDLQGCRR